MPQTATHLHDNITDVPGILVGHAQDVRSKTGVTVVRCPDGAVGGVNISGNASSTRQMDSLGLTHLVNRVDGVCLCGGSAFGLDAGGGALSCLEKRGVGLTVRGVLIPIVPSAAIFDLNFGDGSVRPDWAMGFQACENACAGPVSQGSVGAGTGATVGKLRGIECAMKGGVGSASVASDGLVVAALTVVNAFGDVLDADGNIIAGLRSGPGSLTPADSAYMLMTGRLASPEPTPENTTLAVIAVNAKLDKAAARRIAVQATLGLERVIRPFHTHIDGDLTIVLGVGRQCEDPNRVGLLASEALQRSVIKAVKNADGFGLIPAAKDIRPQAARGSKLV